MGWQNTNSLTIPSIKHVCYEVVNEGDLGFGDAAGIPVKHWHHHRESLSLLFISLREMRAHTGLGHTRSCHGISFLRTALKMGPPLAVTMKTSLGSVSS